MTRANLISRKSVLATAGVGVVAAAAVGIPAAASTHSPSAPQAKTRAIHFTAVELKSHSLGKFGFGETEKEVRAGKIVGFDVINGIFDPATNTAKGTVAISRKGGMIYGKLKFTDTPVTTGRVTGGTGKYKGATGTIKGTNLNKSGSRTAVVVTITTK